MLEVTDGSLPQYLKDHELVLIDFYTHTCPPCKGFAKTLTKVEALMPEVSFVKVNGETESETLAFYNIEVVPTVVLISKKKEIARCQGAQSAKSLETWIRENLK